MATDDKKKKGEPFPGIIEERPDDADLGTPLGGFDDAADAQEGETNENPPQPPPPSPGGGGTIEGGR